jgi:hypothetical protein
MKTTVHVYSSGLLGGTIYFITQSAAISIVAFLSGIFIDIDHIFDFLIFSGEKFSIKNMFRWCHEVRWKKITLIFHSYEFYLILGIITYNFPHDILIGLMAGTGFHIMLDQIGNCFLCKNPRLFPWFYFLTYRVNAGFHKDKLRIDD